MNNFEIKVGNWFGGVAGNERRQRADVHHQPSVLRASQLRRPCFDLGRGSRLRAPMGGRPRQNTKMGQQGNTNGMYGGGAVNSGTLYASADPPKLSQSCSKCGAWYGQLGMEPSPYVFIDP